MESIPHSQSMNASAESTETRLRSVLVAWIGTFVVISAIWGLFTSHLLVYAFASLGGSSVILFGMPEGSMAQPRSLFGGHAIGASCGLLFLVMFGRGPWAIAAATATALALMQVTRSIHSPAGADPIIVMSGGMSLPIVFVDLAAGLLLLWVVAIVLLNAFAVYPYARKFRWIGPIATFIGNRGDAWLQGGSIPRAP
jgi:CBS-domain-containing membrane protein